MTDSEDSRSQPNDVANRQNDAPALDDSQVADEALTPRAKPVTDAETTSDPETTSDRLEAEAKPVTDAETTSDPETTSDRLEVEAKPVTDAELVTDGLEAEAKPATDAELVTDGLEAEAKPATDAEPLFDDSTAGSNQIAHVNPSDDVRRPGMRLPLRDEDASQGPGCDKEHVSAVFRFDRPAVADDANPASYTQSVPSAPSNPAGQRAEPAPVVDHSETAREPSSGMTLLGVTPPDLLGVPAPPVPIGATRMRPSPPGAPSYAPLGARSRGTKRDAPADRPDGPSPPSHRTLEGLVPEQVLRANRDCSAGADQHLDPMDEVDEDDITLVFSRRWLDDARRSPPPGKKPVGAEPSLSTPLRTQQSSVTVPAVPVPNNRSAALRPATPAAIARPSAPAAVLAANVSSRPRTTRQTASSPDGREFAGRTESNRPSSFTVTPDFRPRNPLLRPLVAALSVLAVAAIVLWLIPNSGQLGVDVALAATTELPRNPKVYLDGKLVCSNSHCILDDLEEKSYLVVAEAEGYQRSREHAVLVSADNPAQLVVELKPQLAKLRLGSHGAAVSATLNGEPKGALPLTLEDLPAGTYQLRLDGGSAFRPVTRSIELTSGETLDLRDIALEVKKGTATLTEGTNARGATVRVGRKRVRLPHTFDVDVDAPPTLSVRRRGYEFSGVKFDFEPGQQMRSFAVDLVKSSAAHRADGRTARRRTSARSRRRQLSRQQKSASNVSDEASAAGTVSKGSPNTNAAKTERDTSRGRLNLVSYPPAKIILDGRPIGLSPKRGVPVAAGSHSIVFVHSEKGKKRTATTVTSGSTKTVTARFD